MTVYLVNHNKNLGAHLFQIHIKKKKKKFLPNPLNNSVFNIGIRDDMICGHVACLLWKNTAFKIHF